METQRQWSNKAIKRTTPTLMANFSLVCIIAYMQNNVTKGVITTLSSAWHKYLSKNLHVLLKS